VLGLDLLSNVEANFIGVGTIFVFETLQRRGTVGATALGRKEAQKSCLSPGDMTAYGVE